MQKQILCTNCGKRPRPKDGARLTCKPCSRIIDENAEAEKNRRAASVMNLNQYFRLLKHKGHLVGVMVKNPKALRANSAIHFWDDNMVVALTCGNDDPQAAWVVYIKPISDTKGLPEAKLIDLDVWQDGIAIYDVMMLKASVKKVTPKPNAKRVKATD